SSTVCLLPYRLRSVRFFFFQAEDGIRDRNVTGVQTCALPIFQYLIIYVIKTLHPLQTPVELPDPFEIFIRYIIQYIGTFFAADYCFEFVMLGNFTGDRFNVCLRDAYGGHFLTPGDDECTIFRDIADFVLDITIV